MTYPCSYHLRSDRAAEMALETSTGDMRCLLPFSMMSRWHSSCDCHRDHRTKRPRGFPQLATGVNHAEAQQPWQLAGWRSLCDTGNGKQTQGEQEVAKEVTAETPPYWKTWGLPWWKPAKNEIVEKWSNQTQSRPMQGGCQDSNRESWLCHNDV